MEITVTFYIFDESHQYTMVQEGTGYWMTDGMDSFGHIERLTDGSWIQTQGKMHGQHIIDQIGKQIDEAEERGRKSFGFGLQLNEELIHCEAVMIKNGYSIFFNGQLVADIVLKQVVILEVNAYVSIPDEVLAEISKRIQVHLN